MKKVLTYITLSLTFMLQGITQNVGNPSFVANQLYVKIIPPAANLDRVEYIPSPNNPDLGKSVWDIIKAHGGISMVNTFPAGMQEMKNVYKVNLKEGSDIEGLLKQLNHHDEVEYVEKVPAYYIQAKPIDLDESKQWYFRTINMDASWGTPVVGLGRNKVIAIIDNGVLYNHEDLVMAVAVNNKEIYGNGKDDDGNGYIDDFFGWDVADNDADPSPIVRPAGLPNDEKFRTFGWHGTHVAGIVAASADNNKGIASLGLNNRVLCIKAASSKGETPNDRLLVNINEAIAYAINRNVDVINCSFGSYDSSIVTYSLIKQAIDAGIIIVAAAGNEGNERAFYPAAYDGVIAVGATNRDDVILNGTRFGSYIDVMAPGDDIYSTVSSSTESYGYMSGTSMAAPIVSSIIGLILSKEPDRVNQIEAIIKGGCDNIDWKNPKYTGKMGAGRVNVDKSFVFLYTYGETNSVAQLNNYSDFSVYPNPANTTIFIPFDDISQNGQPVEVKIFNTVGTEVYQQQVSYSQQPISVSQLSQGIYQIVVSNGEKHFRNRLLVNR